MKISDIAMKMISQSRGNLHDTEHFLKVWAYARIIGQREGLDAAGLEILECAALLHDIACPLCREKYGRADGKAQETEGMPLTADFLAEYPLEDDFVEQVVWLVGHHHSVEVEGNLLQRILLEADFLVNAGESEVWYSRIGEAEKELFRTETGLRLLRSVYPDSFEQ